MKRIKTLVAVLSALVLGTSFASADKAQYDKLLAEGKKYEEESKWVHALGAYWDAMGENPSPEADEALTAYNRIYDSFVDSKYGHFTGNPGPGEYDEFSRFDGWIELCKDFEVYWNEHPGEIYDLNFSLKKGELDMKTRTATYDVKIDLKKSKKFEAIARRIVRTYGLAYSNDWEPDLSSAWPAVSAFKDSNTIPVVNLEIKYEGDRLGNKRELNYIYLLESTVINNSLYFSDEAKTYEFFSPAWNCLAPVKQQYSLDDESNLTLKFTITDENGRTIITTDKPVKINSDSNAGEQDVIGHYVASGVPAADIKLLDGNKYKVVIDSLLLTPRKASCAAWSSYGFVEIKTSECKPEKYTVDFLKGNGGFANIDVVEKQKAVSEAAGKAALPQKILDTPGELLLSNRFSGVCYCVTGDFIKDIDDKKEVAAELSKITGDDWDYSHDWDYGYFFYRSANEEELETLKADILEKKDVNKAGKWYKSAKQKNQQKIAGEIASYLISKEFLEKGELHTNLIKLSLKENKGVTSIASVPEDSDFAGLGFKAKDVINSITVKPFYGETTTVKPSELNTVMAPATCVFSVTRGSGKKAQTIEIEVPVKWNDREFIETVQRKLSGTDWINK